MALSVNQIRSRCNLEETLIIMQYFYVSLLFFFIILEIVNKDMIVWCAIIQMKPFEVLFCVTVTLHLELFAFQIFLKIVTTLSFFF